MEINQRNTNRSRTDLKSWITFTKTPKLKDQKVHFNETNAEISNELANNQTEANYFTSDSKNHF